jgi:nitrite reductase (NO-forming)
MLATDPTAKELLKKYNGVPMPNQNLSDEEVRQYLSYFEFVDGAQKK